MIKAYLLIISILTLHIFGYSQSSRLSNEIRIAFNTEDHQQVVPLLVKGDISAIQYQVRMNGGRFKYAAGEIASVEMPLGQVMLFAEHEGIDRIEMPRSKGHVLNDTMIINTRADKVHMGLSPLTQDYLGRDVVIGYLDTGVEIDHPDFMNADSTTRIKYIWDQNDQNGPLLTPYNYGREWNSSDIDNQLCTHKDPNAYYGHGTNVVGIGSGNGRALNDMRGVAPESDIIVVAVGLNQNFLTNVADAIQYIFAKAEAMGKPAVINTSLGDYFGSHDGTDLTAQIIDNMIKAKPGRVVVAAAGNAGNVNFHLGYNITTDTSFTWFKYMSGNQLAYFQIWADSAEFNNVHFSLQADKPAGFVKRVATPFYNVKSSMNLHLATNGFITDTLKVNGNRIGIIDIYGERIGDQYKLDVVVYPDTTSYWWRFCTTGSGYFDVWSSAGLTGTSDMVVSGLPDPSVLPEIVNYKLPDNKMTMVSSWTCLESVITVANYENRKQYLDYNNNPYISSQTPGALANNSSKGPTRDGRIKPDIAAPGNMSVSTGTIAMLNYFISTTPNKVAKGGWHNRNGGTSMASPAVAGVAALYLEKFPDAEYNQVRQALLTTTYQDIFTGNNLPDSDWGFGKVDAFAALTAIHGCTDSSANNYDPLATVDDGSCDTVTVGFTPVESPTTDILKIYPVPVNGSAIVQYAVENISTDAKIEVYNLLGSKMTSFPVTDTSGFIKFDASPFTPGIYFLSLNSGGKKILIQKFVIQ